MFISVHYLTKFVKDKYSEGDIMDIKKIGQNVIQAEIDGMIQLKDTLGEEFTNAVTIIEGTPGKIVVTGMGKSGHIARKIASTMASTGKSSIFLHPAEASHGDLGMLENKDSVIAISNSGESRELYDVLNYCKRAGIKVIGITQKPKSTLAAASDVVLLIPDAKEACPLGLAPTTSTTLSLALGDALAVARYEDDFSAQSFSSFHPGGKLGSHLLTVKQIMHTDKSIPLVYDTQTVHDAILEISKKALGCVGVVKKGKLIGIITDGDLRRHLEDTDISDRVTSIMAHNPITITSETFAAEALSLLNDQKITSLFVLEGAKPIGVVHIHDLLRAGVD